MFKKNIMGIFFATFIMVSNMQTVYGAEKGIVKQCDYLNIRKGPNVNYSVVSKVRTNDVIDIVEKNGNWYKIKTSSNIEGWVNSKYIDSYTQSSDEVKTEQLTAQNSNINKIVKVANTQIGKKYKWGSAGPSSFDCSGFTSYIYKDGAGISLPRTSVSQSKVGIKISRNQLKSGDLVFFNTSGKGISHVGMYIGDSKFIHASTSKGVRIDSLNSSYYKSKFVTASRIIK